MSEENTSPEETTETSSDFDGVSGKEYDILNKEGEESPKGEVPKEEGEGEEEEEEPKEEVEEVEEVEEDEETPAKLRFSEIKKEFPEVLKKFPELRANYFFSEQIKEFFPTVEDAKAASERIEAYDQLAPQVFNGDLSGIIDAISQTNPNALSSVAENIPKILYAQNEQLFFKLANPIIRNLFATAIRKGEETGNKNLKLAAQHLINFVYGGVELPAEQQRPQFDPEKVALIQQQQMMVGQFASSYEGDVKSEAEQVFTKEIESSLELDEKTPKFVKEKLVETIIDDVNRMLSRDPKHLREMQTLWMKAAQSGFPGEMKARIINAFLARARPILPAIRQKRKAEALGNSQPVRKRTNIPPNAGPSKSKSAYVSPKQVKKENLTEMDIIMRGA